MSSNNKFMVVKPIHVPEPGRFYDKSFFKHIITTDMDIYFICPKTKQLKILCHFRKKIIPEHYLQIALNTFEQHAKHTNTSTRGIASGLVDPKKMGNNIAQVLDPTTFKSRVVYKNGTISNYYLSNKVNSIIAGYFDKPKLRDKSMVLKTKSIPCRMTAFTEQHLQQWKQVLPLVSLVDTLYQNLAPDVYQQQRTLANSTPKFVINNTAFSTITINHNFRTACHIDSGDFKHGLSVLLVAQKGQYTGGYLGFPEFGVAIDIKHGDFLLIDPHQYHCNTEFTQSNNHKGSEFTRMSMVFYYRENIQNCQEIL